MDTEANGLADWFLAIHTTDPVLLSNSQLLSNREMTSRPTGRLNEIAEPAVNTETNLATSTTSSSILTGNSRTNVTEVHNSLNAPDPCPPRQLQSAFDSVAQRNFTALMREPPIALPSCISGYIVESLESTNNSRLALEQGITRAAVRIRRVMEEREERELLSNF